LYLGEEKAKNEAGIEYLKKGGLSRRKKISTIGTKTLAKGELEATVFRVGRP